MKSFEPLHSSQRESREVGYTLDMIFENEDGDPLSLSTQT